MYYVFIIVINNLVNNQPQRHLAREGGT